MPDQTPLAAVLHTAARNVDRLVNSRLSAVGLTGARLEALAAYAETPGSSNADMARACDLSAQSGTYVTAALATKGWIAFGEAVGRTHPVHVTDAGLEVLDTGWDAVRPVEKRLATLLGAAGIRRLRDTADALSAETGGAGEPEEDPRFAQVGNAAVGLHFRAVTWAVTRSTGTVPASVVRRWTTSQSGLTARLVDAGLWKPDGDGYRVR